MSFVATINLSEQTFRSVFTPDHYLFTVTNTTNDVVYTEEIKIGSGSVTSLPFDIPDGAYTAAAQLVDSSKTVQGTPITQTFTLPLPGTITTAQVPTSISIVQV